MSTAPYRFSRAPTSGRPPRNARSSALYVADASLVAARAQMVKAALSCLRREYDAARSVSAALSCIDDARASIAALAEKAEP